MSSAASVSLSLVSPTAVQVDDRPHAGRVHLGEVPLDPLGRERRLAAAQMVVHVDDRERPAWEPRSPW